MVCNESVAAMALSMMFPNRLVGLKKLYERMGSAVAIVENADRLQSVLPDFNPKAFSIDRGTLNTFLAKAKEEAEYIEKHSMKCIPMNSPLYPVRLREACPDAPLVLYLCGNADLNAGKIVSIVGTRQSTEYGRDMIDKIVGELAACYPDLIIVSGLAYGTDINAHRAALENNLPTIGVLAHGLDRIYPASHRQTAARMIASGGLVTEFPVGTQPEMYNFLRRNRIIAGLAEATIVVESKEKGGSLNTARLANDYNLAVMACPGRATDATSAGCNNLIRNQVATMVTSGRDVVETLGWEVPQSSQVESTPTLFDNEFSGEEKFIYRHLDAEGKHINLIVSETGLSVSTIMSVLYELEFRGAVRQLPGSKWRKVL